jgi:hypothetical protein
MEMSFDQVNNFVIDLPIYALNGLLWLMYLAVDYLPALVSVGIATTMGLVVDESVQKLASARPLRDGRGGMQSTQKTSQVITGIVLVLWLAAQWNMGQPVPWIGATMWITGLIAILAVPAQRFSLLNGVKVGIVTYALAVIISRVYMTYTSQVTPEQWATLLGSTDTAAQIIANTRANSTTVAIWALWLVVPLGYFSMLAQQTLLNPISLTNPLATYEQMLLQLRDHGGS